MLHIPPSRFCPVGVFARCPHLAYGKLKKALKGKAGDPATFQDRLHKEVGKVSCFVEKQARSLTKRWAELPAAAGEVREQSTRRLYARPPRAPHTNCGPRTIPHARTELPGTQPPKPPPRLVRACNTDQI